MAGSKKVKQREQPSGRHIALGGNPDQYYADHPSWNFYACDTEEWPFTEAAIGNLFWNEILPRLKDFEKQSWNDILLIAKNSNHSIDPANLSSAAQTRLANRYIEGDSVISLRFNGTHRMYGFMTGAVFKNDDGAGNG